MVEKNGTPGSEPVVRRVKPADTGAAEKPASRVLAAKPKAVPRTKVTPEELEARFTAALASRKAQKAGKTPRDMGKVARIVLASALGVGIVGFSLGINNAGEQHTVAVKANEDKEAAITGALEELTPANGKNTRQELVDGLAAAQKRSDELAAAQQQFASIAYAGNDDPGSNDGRPKPAVLKSLDHRKAITPFFDPGSLILSDDQAYTFRTEDLLGPGRIDPRQPWFTRYEPVTDNSSGTDSQTAAGTARKAMDPAGYTWRTASVTLSGTPGVMSVVWTNSDTTTGDLLAWATARYSVKTNTFRGLSVGTTTRGDSFGLKVGSTSPGTGSGTATGGNA
ncbi:hypothetical protein [Arthrobacter sp. AD-310]